MSLTNTELDEVPERAAENVYTALVLDDAVAVLNEGYPHQSARRDAVVAILVANHDEVSPQTVEQILTPYGGANADMALAEIVALYADYGVDVHLGEHLRDAGPATLFSALTDYGDGEVFAEHYGSRAERLTQLRWRAANLSQRSATPFFEKADELACTKVIEGALAPTNGHLYLFEAKRQAVGDTYLTA